MSHLNIEIKAKSERHTAIKAILEAENARFIGIDHQIDTYFEVETGRLKLREGQIENSLIFYDREDKAGPKKSDILLFRTHPDSTLKAILMKTQRILTVVDKKRAIYFIDNVKFHLDTVEGLGTFVEIEAIDSEEFRPTETPFSPEHLYAQCQHYMQLFGIQDTDLCTHSYSDLLLQKA